MIRSLEVLHPEDMPLPWWSKVRALAAPKTWVFQPGLNILWGPNGSGKTTILKALARIFHCEQSGNPVLTETSLATLFQPARDARKEGEWASKVMAAFRLDHDGQGVRHFDPSKVVGSMGSSFDYDFMDEGLANVFSKGSSGQTTLRRLSKIVEGTISRTVPVLDQRMHAEHVNSLWAARIHVALKLMEGTAPLGPPTILCDEPERSADIPNQIKIWRFLRDCALESQVIVASHTLFALNLPEAHYIEMADGYLDASKKALDILMTTWAPEPPRKLPEPRPKD